MRTMAFFLEEPSAKEMLKEMVPRIIPADFQVRFFIFQGKQDLEKNLKTKLRGWMLPDSVFVVMRDQDSGNCVSIKEKLVGICESAGKKGVLIRLACHELESFYLGDLAAIEQGLSVNGLARQQNQKKFRNPDALGNAAEELVRMTKNKYQKLAGSRAIAPYLNLENNRSHSFNVLVSGIRRLAET